MNNWWLPAKASINKVPRWAVMAVAVLLVLGMGGSLVWALRPEQHHIAVSGLETPVAFITTEKQLGAALRAQGIALNAKDQISPDLSTILSGKKNLTVTVKKAVPASVFVDGKTITADTQAATVADLLKELGVTVNPRDGVTYDLQAPVEKGMTVKVVRRTQAFKVVREEVPFEVVREDDRSMMVGETKELQAGANGVKEIKHVVYYEDGKEVGSEIAEEKILTDPTNQVVAYGVGGVVSRAGRTLRYTREMHLTSTGYTAGKESNPDGNGYTYTGMKAVRGVIAVDPRVIPLYTRVYIEGYGPAVAGDIGGAIKGNRIDLCFDSLGEALDWGIRDVTVYILGD